MPAGEPEAVAAARTALGLPVVEEACGPYRLVTDATGVQLGRIRALCSGPVAALEGEYRARLGIAPAHPPAGTLVLFAERPRYRRYAAADPALPQVYAGFSLAADGLVALPVGDLSIDEVTRTLIHELAHLAHRRAFGLQLEPWLSEGLSDAFGYSAGPEGFAPLAGFTGLEGLRARLLGGYALGRAGSVERLVGLSRDQFDRGPVSYDYDQSALFVRFLLLDPELSSRFRAWLAARTGRGEVPPVPLPEALGVDLDELERRFRQWMGAPGRVAR
ncbi:MAG TPA: hypothetical protein VLA75_12565 [Thermoanaerobaculia bacterium]|nr:hypothetical protein [Thermoanaerobaculia bacterium]